MKRSKDYVTGLLYDSNEVKVLLIRKAKPEKHRNLLNGLGGMVELGETPQQAIAREVKEESGLQISACNWIHFFTLSRVDKYNIHFLSAYSSSLKNAQSMELEQVHQYDLCRLPEDIVPNLKWIIPLSLDKRLKFDQPIILNQY